MCKKIIISKKIKETKNALYKFCHMEKIQSRLRDNVKLLSCHLNLGSELSMRNALRLKCPRNHVNSMWHMVLNWTYYQN